MYYFLNYLPIMLQAIIFVIPINLDMPFALYAILNLFIMPIYVFFVNAWYMQKEMIAYPKSILLMISVPMLNVLMFMIAHKIEQGTFIGDVPEGIYYIMFFVPIVIILIGVLILYHIDNKCC